MGILSEIILPNRANYDEIKVTIVIVIIQSKWI